MKSQLEPEPLPLGNPASACSEASGPSRRLASEVKDLCKRSFRGDARAFLSAHPHLLAHHSLVLDLIYDEYCQQQETGHAPDPETFCARYPEYRADLLELFQALRFMGSNPELWANGPVASWPQVGEMFLGFNLLRELGRGSFSQVFLAREPALGDRLVAVKVSRLGAAEAQTLGRLNHPHIVPVYSVREDANTKLTVVCMPYLGCATLAHVLEHAFAAPQLPRRAALILEAVQDPSVPAEQVSDRTPTTSLLARGSYVDGVVLLGTQLAEALAFIHERGICHRDLKPSNVLMSAAASPMLLDFNLAFDQQQEEGLFGGTWPYMSPEQLRATEAGQHEGETPIDGRSDLFSLAVILYELLAGKHPFGPIPSEFTVPELRQQLLERQAKGPSDLRALNPDVDLPLARLLERCLACDPNERPQSARELVAKLRRQLTVRQRVRHLRRMLAAGLLLLAVGVSGAPSWSLPGPEARVASRQAESLNWLRRGEYAYSQGKYEQALQYFDRALAADSKRSDALVARGRTYQQLAMHSKALADASSDEGSKPQLRAEQRRQLDNAIQDYGTALQLESYSRSTSAAHRAGVLHACIGYCEGLLTRHGPAITAYKQAIQVGFATAEVYNNLGFEQRQKDLFAAARENLNQAIRLAPQLGAARHNRAMLDFQDALAKLDAQPQLTYLPSQGLDDMQQALTLQVTSGELYFDAARLYALAARCEPRYAEPALDYLERAVAWGQDPGNFSGEPTLTVLRERPRFQCLRAKVSEEPMARRAIRLLDPARGYLE